MFTQSVVDDDFVLIDEAALLSQLTTPLAAPYQTAFSSRTPKYISRINTFVDKISPVLRPLNLSIHDNPELGYREYHAHKVLTEFLASKKGWHVTPSAYGLETAFVAVFDSGSEGPVVSFNVEYGM